MEDKLAPSIKLGVKRVGIQGARAQAKEMLRTVKPEECPNRYAIGFDDSGSMGSSIQDAKRAVAGFLGSCNPVETSVAIVPFSGVEGDGEHGVKAQPLTNQYDLINAYLAPVKATSGTPLYGTMKVMMEKFPITRGVLFSDGSPTDGASRNWNDDDQDGTMKTEEDSVLLAIEKKIPFDCVYIGHGTSTVLKHIAKVTGGEYLEFTDTAVFAKQMKYLSPRYVALLANAELKEKIQRGENI